MNFIRSIVNEEDIVLDSEVEDLLEQLKNLDQPRFTAAEWAAIEGGHDVSDVDQIDEDAWNRISARVSARDLAMYKFIVGAENLMQAKMFMQMAKQGRSIPKSYVEGFMPALEILDDIVTAGPGYVQMLKVLQKRAKRS